jgi:sulfite reductase (NADPH) flavoprotein alpha-component
LLIWWRRRRASQVRVAGNAAAAKAEIVVLVGSESGITWGFARSLHSELSASGLAVHLAEIRDFSGSYPAARQILFLTSTYGDGHAPETAQNALSLLDRQEGVPQWHFAVLGFGDRAFSKYCQFAKDIDIAMADRGWPALLPITLINRQSAQAFASWGNDLGHAIGHELKLNHQVTNPRTRKLKLVSRTDHGGDLQAPTAILRFEVSTASDASPSWLNKVLGGPSGFTPTDLLGILPPDDPVPRYYSVASGASDAEVEICVRKLNGGRCSTLLHALALGDEIDAFVRPNPDFSLPSRRKPVIMVSAGTGIAPFTGIVRDNRRKQPLHLFWGGRNSTSDYLYHDVLQEALTQNHLATLTTAFSRVEDAAHVQDRVRSEATRLADLLRKGASVMVCGGDAMAHAVRQEFDDILRTIGSSVDALKQRGLYLEDVF